MSQIDYVNDNKSLYRPTKEASIVDVPKMQFIMVDGKGAPDPDVGNEKDVSEFTRAVGVLYGLAYSIKMSYKGDNKLPGYTKFKVPPLEALWWMSDDSRFDVKKPEKWRWTAMIRMPSFVTVDIIKEYIEKLNLKKKTADFSFVRLENFTEGKVVQILHIGPYSAEGRTIEAMHNYAKEGSFKLHGKHHEIYYGDPRRSSPEKLKTVLRNPIK